MELIIRDKDGNKHELDIGLERSGDGVAVTATGAFGRYYILNIHADGTASRIGSVSHETGLELDDRRRIVMEDE